MLSFAFWFLWFSMKWSSSYQLYQINVSALSDFKKHIFIQWALYITQEHLGALGRDTDSYLPHLHRPSLRRGGPWWSQLSSNHRRKSPPTNCGLCPRSEYCCQPWRRLTGAVIRHTQACKCKWQWKSAMNTWQNGHRWKHAPQHGCMFNFINMTAANVGATMQQLLVLVLLAI